MGDGGAGAESGPLGLPSQLNRVGLAGVARPVGVGGSGERTGVLRGNTARTAVRPLNLVPTPLISSL